MTTTRTLCSCCHAASAHLAFDGDPVCSYCHPDGVRECARLDGHPGCEACDRVDAEIAAATRVRFVLSDTDGEIDSDVDVEAFAADNELEPEEVAAIHALHVGGEMLYGGGASPLFRLVRVA